MGDLSQSNGLTLDVGTHSFTNLKEKNDEVIKMLDTQDETEASETDDVMEHPGNLSSARKLLNRLFVAVLLAGYYVYVGFSLYLNPTDSVLVCIIAVVVGVYTLDRLSRRRFRTGISRLFMVARQRFKLRRKTATWMRRVSTVISVLGIAAFLIYDIQDQWNRYTPLAGLVLFILLSLVFSTDVRKINWIPVIWGLILQFCLGLLILRWEPGFAVCHWAGQYVTKFLAYADAGSRFVFGPTYKDHRIAFQVCPVVVFFSACVHVLYYLGVMQIIIKAIAVILQTALSTTPIESFATAASIFLGMSETSVIIRPFLKKLTLSEIHAIMTGAFATLAGSLVAMLISFGIPAEHLITASFMSAPAALTMSKISMPETAESQIKSQEELHTRSGSEVNVLEALTAGATSAIKLVAYILVNLIAFVAAIDFLDAVLAYFGSRVNCPQLSFQLVCSYAFMPLAAVIGIPWEECGLVGALIGKRTIVSGVLAYADLGKLTKAGAISDFSATIATYCLCGLSNVMSIGINLACLSSAEPTRRSDFARLSVRSLMNGNIACFMTACIAGLLYKRGDIATVPQTMMNDTVASNLNITYLVNVTASAIFLENTTAI